MLTKIQLDAILDRLYKKVHHSEKDKENIKFYEDMYQDVVESEEQNPESE